MVAYLQKHEPEGSRLLANLLSPLLTHCKMLRQSFGQDIAIVFIGPCIGKKIEAAQHPELLDVVLTFEDLRRWFEQEKIAPSSVVETPEDRFVPEAASEGAWYPVDGGMIAGMKSSCGVNDCSLMAFSGLGAIRKALDRLDEARPEEGLFLELLACEGGCVNGPKVARRDATVVKRRRVLRPVGQPSVAWPRRSTMDIESDFSVSPPGRVQYPDTQIREALRGVGKLSADDELNCGGCGYDTCREFAIALIAQKAERAMCVTYMRKLAHKKANALIQKMPSVQQSSDVSGSVSVLRGTEFQSLPVGAQVYYVGVLPWWTQLRLWAAEYPWLIAIVVVLLAFLLAIWTRQSLRSKARARLTRIDN